jgi:hypothetical protein
MLVKIRAHTKTKNNKVVESDKCVDVYVNKAPVKGRANKEIIKMLAKYFKVKTNKIFLISGEKSKNKEFEIKSDIL